MDSLIQTCKFVKGLAPAADRWNTNPATDIVSMADYDKLVFLVHQEGGTTGKATLTVEACSDVSASATSAIAFRYSVGAAGAGAAGDLHGAITAATTAGFDTTPNGDRLYLVEVKAEDLPSGYPFVRLKCTEAANDPVNGCVDIILFGARYAGSSLPTAIA